MLGGINLKLMKKYNYRNSKGQFITKRNQRAVRRTYTYLFMLAMCIGVGTYAELHRDQSVIAPAVSAMEVASTTVEIAEVTDIPNKTTASDVAMWFTDSNVKLLKMVMDGSSVDDLQALLDEQHMYARAVMINDAE